MRSRRRHRLTTREALEDPGKLGGWGPPPAPDGAEERLAFVDRHVRLPEKRDQVVRDVAGDEPESCPVEWDRHLIEVPTLDAQPAQGPSPRP